MNAIPIVHYGAMPVRVASREVVSADALREPSLFQAKHVEMDLALGLHDPVSLLIDCIPLPIVSAVVSGGDLLLLAGFLWLGLTMRSGPEPAPQTSAGVERTLPKVENSATEGSSSISRP